MLENCLDKNQRGDRHGRILHDDSFQLASCGLELVLYRCVILRHLQGTVAEMLVDNLQQGTLVQFIKNIQQSSGERVPPGGSALPWSLWPSVDPASCTCCSAVSDRHEPFRCSCAGRQIAHVGRRASSIPWMKRPRHDRSFYLLLSIPSCVPALPPIVCRFIFSRFRAAHSRLAALLSLRQSGQKLS